MGNQKSNEERLTDAENPASQSNIVGYSGVVLLGWMEREQAVRFLIGDCIFEQPLTAQGAEKLWNEWRDRAASIPPREAAAPEQVPLTEAESDHAERFLTYLGSLGVANLQVLKIDPMQLVVMQHHINVDVAARYSESNQSDDAWMAQTLPLSSGNPDLNIRFTRRNLDTEIDIDLPHAEFIFGVHPQGGFGPKELMGHVTVLTASNRMLLGKGYHRLYGRVMSTGGAMPDRLSLVGIDPTALTSPAGKESGDYPAEDPGLHIFGQRPPIFADFFTEGLAMPVYLRPKRYQLQVRSHWVAIDAD